MFWVNYQQLSWDTGMKDLVQNSDTPSPSQVAMDAEKVKPSANRC